MKTLFALALLLITGTSAHAGTSECTSVGDLLPTNRLILNVKLERTWLGTVTGGTYSYKESESSAETGSGEFACKSPNERGIVFCGALRPDMNIQSIVVHPIMGLTMQLSGQSHIVLFSCN